MSTNVQDWVDATRWRLQSGQQDQLNKISAAYTAGDTTLSFSYPLNGIRAGATLTIGTNTFYVWEADNSANTATVQGGWDGTTDVSAASGSIVRVQPRFTDAQILSALNDDLNDLCSPHLGLYQIGTASLTYDNSLVGYDLSGTPGLLSIIEVRLQGDDAARDWPRLPSHKYRILKGAPFGDDGFSSGNALFLYGGNATTGDTIHVTYRKAFNQVSSVSSSKSASGLPQSAWDLPPIGAAISLMAGREIKRSFTESQGDPRRAAEVGPGASAASVNALRLLRQERINAERQRLDAFYPAIKDA